MRIASACMDNFFYMERVAVGTSSPSLLKTVADELTEVIRDYVPWSIYFADDIAQIGKS